MSKKLSLIFVFVAVTCLPARFATADYTLANGSATEDRMGRVFRVATCGCQLVSRLANTGVV